jgi:hypothetical protein
VGQDLKHLKDGVLAGAYTKEDIAAQKKRLEQTIAENTLYGSHCWYKSSTGWVNCTEDCPRLVLGERECPEILYNKTKRALSRLNTLRFLTMAFSDPNIAKANHLLPKNLLSSHL